MTALTHFTLASRSGAARYTFLLADALADSGLKFSFVCPEDYEWRTTLNSHANISLDLIPAVRPSGYLAKFTSMYMQSRRLTATLAAHGGRRWMFHANFPGSPLLARQAFRSLARRGSRLVYTVHDVVPHYGGLPGALGRLERAAHDDLIRRADHVVVLSQHGHRLLLDDFGLPAEAVTVIPHGPFQVAEGPLPIPPREGGLRLLLFGKIRRNKRVLETISAVQHLRANGADVLLTVAGPSSASESHYRDACLRRWKTAPEGITLVNQFIPEADLAALLRQHHLLLLPYADFHSQSGVAALAMSNGRPLVATKAGGLSELMTLPGAGFIIDGDTRSSIETAIERAADADHHTLEGMARRLYDAYRQAFSWERIARLHRSLYERLGVED